jgi:hypothetical protein
MTKKFGKLTSKGWRKCRILYDDDADADADGDADADDHAADA